MTSISPTMPESSSVSRSPETPILPCAEQNLVTASDPIVGRVVETHLCTAGGRKSAGIVRHVSVDVAGTPLEGRFMAGQSFGVLPPGTDSQGNAHAVRLYSICSPSHGEDGDGAVLATTVKRTIIERESSENESASDQRLFLGVASNYLCNLRVDEEVRICGPQGKRFLLPENRTRYDYVFIATGTGIAPFRGMVLDLLSGPDGPTDREIHLIAGSPYTTDLLYDGLFQLLSEQHTNFHYHTAISREPMNGTDHGEYAHDVLMRNRDTFTPLLRSQETLIYACGVFGMQYGLYQSIAMIDDSSEYFKIGDELIKQPPAMWTTDQMKKSIRTADRMKLEVY